MVKVEPLPTSELTEMSPPMMLVMRRAIVSPRPVPPKRRVDEASTCVNGSNSRSRSALAMPDPVSVTMKSKRTRLGATREPRVRNVTTPSSVNLTALDRRLCSTWQTRKGSPRTTEGTSPSVICSNPSPLAAACASNGPVIRLARSSMETSTVSKVILPASILVMSRMSFSSDSRLSPELRMIDRYSRCVPSSLVAPSSCAAPRTPFMGVRSSCEMTPRKLDFASLAAAALSRAVSNSSIRCA